MPNHQYLSWGRTPRAHQTIRPLRSRHDPLPKVDTQSLLPYGLGRSYGDVCLNDRNSLLPTRALNRWISFDDSTGILQCEAGVSLAEILSLAVPRGWFLPVTPGTKFVTLGGAIANDVHGKNHHRAGAFGTCVRSLELLRSDRSPTLCSRTRHAPLFRATLGGLGLTGLVTRAEIQLRPIHNPWINEERLPIRSLSEFFDLADASDTDFEYTVAWIDTLATGDQLGRGVFLRGNHPGAHAPLHPPPARPRLSLPLNAPSFLLNQHTLRLFNSLYARGTRHGTQLHRSTFDSFFYPLDQLGAWNRLYGKSGFFQHQCVVPRDGKNSPIRDILHTVARSDQNAFLSVLKCFGPAHPEGLLSFPRPGVTLALDFPNRGAPTRKLLDELDAIVFRNGGALYPAKDARMQPAHFRQSFPALDHFAQFIDPAFSSSFARRVLLPALELS